MSTIEVLFSAAAFLAGISLLHRGVDLFVDSASGLARLLHLPEVLVALLVAGAEWEELSVVVLSLAQQRPALAAGNVLGSTIANILGAFGLGLIFSSPQTAILFDKTAKFFTFSLFLLTSLVSLVSLAGILNRIVGVVLFALFFVYVGFVLWTICKGLLADKDDVDVEAAAADVTASTAPVEHEHGHEDGHQNGHGHEHEERHQSVWSHIRKHRPHLHRSPSSSSSSSSSSSDEERHNGDANEHTPILSRFSPKKRDHRISKMRTAYSSIPLLLKLVLGFFFLTVSGFILSISSAFLSDAWGLPDTVFGATILSIATSIPEQFVAVMSSQRRHPGIMVADAVGSNIFLLTLCMGVTVVCAGAGFGESAYSRIEVWFMWAAAAVLLAVVTVGQHVLVGPLRPMVGSLMLVGYGAFLAVEFTLNSK